MHIAATTPMTFIVSADDSACAYGDPRFGCVARVEILISRQRIDVVRSWLLAGTIWKKKNFTVETRNVDYFEVWTDTGSVQLPVIVQRVPLESSKGRPLFAIVYSNFLVAASHDDIIVGATRAAWTLAAKIDTGH